jgi:hypothetical protein
MTAALNIISLADHFMSESILKHLWTKVCQDLQEYFINRAVATQAWPHRAHLVEQAVTQGWILEGTYTLAELQERFAPRHLGNPRIADPNYQVIAATVIEAVSGHLRALLATPEYADLAASTDLGADLNQIHQRILGRLQRVCQLLVKEVASTEVPLSETSLRDAGRRRVFEATVELQEELLLQRANEARRARYKQLLKGWQTFSGDIHDTHIGTGTPMAHVLRAWLMTLSAQDAAAFLACHHPSARTAAQLALPENFWLAVTNAEAPVITAQVPRDYAQLQRFVDTVLGMPGYRRITVTKDNSDPVVVNVDLYQRVGSDESGLKKFLHLILSSLRGRAGIIVRAFQTSTVNVFVPESNSFSQTSVHHLFGALLENGQVWGFSAKAVEEHLSKSVNQAIPRHKQPALRYFDWPDKAALNRAMPPESEAD